MLRLPADLRRLAKIAAASVNVSLHAYLLRALRAQLLRDAAVDPTGLLATAIRAGWPGRGSGEDADL
jgi:hypothetical protein